MKASFLGSLYIKSLKGGSYYDYNELNNIEIIIVIRHLAIH